MRKQWLRRALRDYPVYDPPHKVEERLLSKEQARENFDYFMSVRVQRVAHFQRWLHCYFRVNLTPNRQGVRRLNQWANKYAGLLLPIGSDGHPTDTYFDYQPSWTGDCAGCNVVFDMGIAMGESIIAQCPNLHWDVDPISAILPRVAKSLKQSAGASFQRPVVTGFDNLATWYGPLHDIYISVAQIWRYLTTYAGINRFYSKRSSASRRSLRRTLVSEFDATLRAYPIADSNGLRNRMSDSEYFKLIDSQSDDEEEGHE
ncbi:hypothetical protein [Burkholderia sp. Ac-20353]|uniref:hypothetical protein n=1 Tax=Burkholderia sp. Ac-20353 TaxID=2703894 RepID=UPI00197BC559|nr:hypothetical protein [Burkholderia sp. Ac-20353]MBN3792228.1 hypothetical protein [Burkholderia sp. Ac-20353]